MIKKMTLRTTPLPLVLALALAGCGSLAPKYERPAAPVAQAFPDAVAGVPASAATGEAAASIAWQRFFADARLRQLIDLSLVNNRDLRVAILNIEQARAQYDAQMYGVPSEVERPSGRVLVIAEACLIAGLELTHYEKQALRNITGPASAILAGLIIRAHLEGRRDDG